MTTSAHHSTSTTQATNFNSGRKLLQLFLGCKWALRKPLSGQICWLAANPTIELSGDSRIRVLCCFGSVEEYLKRENGAIPDLALLDISMHGERDAGLQMTQIVRESAPDAVIIMFSQLDDASTVVRYLAAGADDFLSKETLTEELGTQLLECFVRAKEKRMAESGSHDPMTLSHVTCVGRTMRNISTRMSRLLLSSIRSIHITGETGTGKEIVAQILHSHLKNTVPFFAVNCGALSPTLLESQLFGHAKGAFTGAQTAKEGYFEVASGGWLFLDEVADLSMTAQVALLRVLEAQEVCRLGETMPRKVNVRVISATNQDLERLVSEGKFRLDLLERLSGHVIRLPPLRERRDEIEPLCYNFLGRIAGGRFKLSRTTLEILKAYSWPANVRELLNTLVDMTAFASGEVLNPSAIPRDMIKRIMDSGVLGTSGKESATVNAAKPLGLEFQPGLESYETAESRLFIAFLEHLIEADPSLSLRQVSQSLKIPRTSLTGRLRKLQTNRVGISERLANLSERLDDEQ